MQRHSRHDPIFTILTSHLGHSSRASRPAGWQVVGAARNRGARWPEAARSKHVHCAECRDEGESQAYAAELAQLWRLEHIDHKPCSDAGSRDTRLLPTFPDGIRNRHRHLSGLRHDRTCRDVSLEQHAAAVSARDWAMLHVKRAERRGQDTLLRLQSRRGSNASRPKAAQ